MIWRTYLALTAFWMIVGVGFWFNIQFECGLGPDSPELCNIEADHKAQLFVGFYLIGFGIFTMTYWARRRRNG